MLPIINAFYNKKSMLYNRKKTLAASRFRQEQVKLPWTAK